MKSESTIIGSFLVENRGKSIFENRGYIVCRTGKSITVGYGTLPVIAKIELTSTDETVKRASFGIGIPGPYIINGNYIGRVLFHIILFLPLDKNYVVSAKYGNQTQICNVFLSKQMRVVYVDFIFDPVNN